jgi:hypothetical protein
LERGPKRGPVDRRHPWAVDARPEPLPREQIIGRQRRDVVDRRLVGERDRRAEAVRCEAGSRALVVEAGCRGTVVDRRTEGGQASVSEVERLPGVEEEDPVEMIWYSKDRIPRPRNVVTSVQPRRVENLHQAPGVIAVGVGQIDPPQVSARSAPRAPKEVRPGGGQAAVDEQRLLGLTT